MENQPAQNGTIQPIQPATSPVNQALPVQPTLQLPKQSFWKLVAIVSVVLLIGMGAVVVYLLQKQTQSQPVVLNVVPTTMPSPTTAAMVDETAGWKTYTDPTHNFTLKYPSGYEVTGKLASSLETWRAGQGIHLTNSNNPANPDIFIEAVFDGYGPFFPTGRIKAEFVNGKLVASLEKLSLEGYDDVMAKELANNNKEDYRSNLVEYNGIPFQFSFTYTGKDNKQIEKEVAQILSTFEFINNTSANTYTW